MAITYDAPSTNWQTASETTAVARVIYPIPQNTSAIIYERDYVQNQANWAPTALDTADGTYTSAFLVEETPPQQISGTLVSWTQRFATVPSDWINYEMMAYTFPGYYGDPTETDYRAPLAAVAQVKITLSYTKTTDPFANISIPSQKFQSVDDDGVRLDYVDDSSTPTYTAYDSDVSASNEITATDSTMSRYLGNIWVTQEITIVAQ